MVQPEHILWQERPDMTRISLQFFAEGASGEGGSDGSSGAVDGGAPAGDTNDTGSTTSGGEGEKDFFEGLSETDRNAFLKKHGLMFHSDAKRRYQGSVDKAAKYDAFSSHMGVVAERYGVSVDDPEGLAKAILNDPNRIRAKAVEMGVSEDVAKTIVAADATEAIRKAQMAERVRNEAYTRMREQEAEVKEAYPSFDIDKAGKNPAFSSLYDSGKFTMKEAYELAFGRELNAAAIEAAKQEARAAALAEYKANGERPDEGAAGQPGNARVDPSKLKGKALDDFLESFMTH